MAYVPHWGRLGDALRRVMGWGLSQEEAQQDICNAIADRKIRLRPRVELITRGSVDAWNDHRFAGEYRHFLGGLFDGTLPLEVPSRLGPAELNWAESRFETPWQFEPGLRDFPGPIRSGHVWIELFNSDITKVLFNAQSHDVRTAHDETAAIRALTLHLGNLENNQDLTRENAFEWCRANGFSLSARGFQSRVWPKAREDAGLSPRAAPGRKPKPG
jgi:hypothetical protein